MRGAPILVAKLCLTTGIIPADAGSTGDCPSSGDHSEDHPRGCGEHGPRETLKISSLGSSPRMRGALHAHEKYSLFNRIIPADAGSTFYGVCGFVLHEDHPRGCGEHRHWRVWEPYK